MPDIELAETAWASFARHETFAPRIGWLSKGFAAASADPGVFRREDAPVVLGTGANMARSIRHWMLAFKLAAERPSGAGQRGTNVVPTWEACWLLSDNGADPWLEETASLWLLHWWLLTPRSTAPTWQVAFSTGPSGRFREAALAAQVTREAARAGWDPPAQESVRRDIACLTGMYSRYALPEGGSRASAEDALSCQFRELGLLTEVDLPGSREWRFAADPGPGSLPDEVTAYACLDYASRAAPAAGSISLSRLAREPGSPGTAFLLTEDRIAAALGKTAGSHPEITVTQGISQRSLVFRSPPQPLAWDILDGYYGQARDRVPSRAQWAARSLVYAPAREAPRRGHAPGQGTLFGPGTGTRRLH